MRFGAFVPQGWRLDLVDIPANEQWPQMLEAARLIERIGFESVWVFDHFHTVPVPTQEATHEAWTLMAALAATTDTVRLGQMCTCNSYRSPSYLAKVASSVDVISGGRVEMGIGGGWYEHEYLAYGYDFPKPSVRLGQLDEAVQIMKAMWTEPEATFHGRHYRVDGAINSPKPLQDPHIPLWIAGGGEQLTLRTAAKYADYTNFGSTIEEFEHKSEVLAKHCADVGTDYDAITRTSNFTVFCAETESEVAARLDWIRAHLERFADADDVARRMTMYGGMAGTPAQLVEKLGAWQDAGTEYAILVFQDVAYDTTSIELFASEVIPALA